MTVIRFKVPYDNGTVCCAEGETCSEFTPGYAARLVRSGLAEFVPGNKGVNQLRAEAGLPPLPSMSMTKAELLEMAAERGVVVETDDNKADLVRKIEGV